MELPKSVKPAVIAAVTNALVAMPSMAGEPGKIFDFNLTLPIIATEFLLLMVILDKTIFGPVGKALDDRDALIRDEFCVDAALTEERGFQLCRVYGAIAVGVGKN